MGFHGHWPYAGPAPAMRDTKCLVQVQVRHIGTEPARTRNTHHGIHVGTVKIHLPTRLVNNVAQLDNTFLENPMGRRVGNHDRRKMVTRFGNFAVQVIQVYVASGIGGHHTNLKTCQMCRCRIGAMRRRWDKTNRTLVVAPAVMPGTNRQQTGVFALGP